MGTLPPVHSSEEPVTQTPTTHAPAPPFEGSESNFYPSVPAYLNHDAHRTLDGLVFGGAPEPEPFVPGQPYAASTSGWDDGDVQHNDMAHPHRRAVPQNPPGFGPHPTSAFLPDRLRQPLDHPRPGSVPPNGNSMQTADNYHPQAGQVPYQDYSPRNGFVPVNGAASSHSPSPLKSQLGDTKASSERGGNLNGAPLANGAVLPNAAPNGQLFEPAKFNEAFELAGYLNAQVNNSEFADFRLRVHTRDALLLSMPVHGVVVARSAPILATIRGLSSPTSPPGTPPFVDIPANSPFVSPESLSEAVKVLYGTPLVDVDNFCYRLGPFHPNEEHGPTFSDARGRMSQAMSYAAAAKLFQLYNMHQRGTELIKGLLRWDTIDQATSYALAAGPYTRDRAQTHKFIPHPSNPTEFHAAQLLDHDIVDFIAFNFPPGFRLYASAPELRDAPRLPTVLERPAHKTRLSGIRFGDIPTEDELNPDYVTRVLSSVLFSLPLQVIDRLLNHSEVIQRVGWQGIQRLIESVIRERERRREEVLNNSQSRLSEMENGSVPQGLMENMFWAEHATPSSKYPSGFFITETRVTEHV